MALQSREALAERLAHEEALKVRLARLEAQYERLDQGLSQIEAEMEIDGSAPEAPADIPPMTPKSRRGHPRKPR